MSILDVENLQKLSYERCKFWSGIMEDISGQETLHEIDLNDLEHAYGTEYDANDSNNELASMEEDDDDPTVDREVLRNILNTTRLSLILKKPLPAQDSTLSEEQNDLIDFVNETLPIINENNRQLREFGLEKILSTFDMKQIEEKVGGWLNRHNSLYGGDSTLLYTAVAKDDGKADRQLTPYSTALCGKTNYREVVDDTDDSLQSGETARYIRSSRTKSVKKSTTTMIKTYRNAKSTREALREKYACELDDYEPCHRKRASNIQHCKNRFDVRQYYKAHKYEMALSSSKQHRRKVLRKRTSSNSCSTIDSSSDSDYSYNGCRKSTRKYLTTCRHLYSASRYKSCSLPFNFSSDIGIKKSVRCSMKMPLARNDRIYYYSHAKAKRLSTSSSSSSSSSNSVSSIIELRRKIKRNADHLYDNDDDSRPCKRESDCQCGTRRKLCDKYKHVTDTSTDEWFIENCSPKKIPKTQSNKIKAVFSANKKLTSSIEIAHEDLRTEKIISETKSKATRPPKEKLSSKNKASDKDSRDNRPKKKTSSKSKNNLKDETLNNSELEMAIEASKKAYEEEQQRRLNKERVPKDVEEELVELRPPVKKPASRKTKKVCSSDENAHKTSKTKNNVTQDVQFTKILPKANDDDAMECNSVTMTMSAMENLNSIPENPFAIAQTICNSTALSVKSRAYNRQIADPYVEQEGEEKSMPVNDLTEKETKPNNFKAKESIKKETKSTRKNKKQLQTIAAVSSTVISTTLHSPERNCKLASKQYAINETERKDVMNNDDKSDCELVTSSTNINLTLAKTINKKTNEQVPKNSILIYTPDNRNMVPTSSFTSDGYLTITKEHLSGIIGENPAEKFIKYYMGCKRFNLNSTIYYIPPTTRTLNGNQDLSLSDSSDDLDYLGQSGNLYVINK